MRQYAPPVGSSPDTVAVSACLLCFNDAATIGGLVEEAGRALDSLGARGEIVVVDDGSTDDSARVLELAAEREPRLRVVRHAANRGYGGALASVLREARGEWVFYTDGDGQYDPGELVRIRSLAGPEIDVVQGFKRGRADPLIRRLIGSAYSQVARWGFGLRIRDPDCDLRLIRGDLARATTLESESGAAPVELVWRLQRAGARFVETEVAHFSRHAGSSQFFTLRSVSRTIADIVRLWATLIVRPRLGRLLGRGRGDQRSGEPASRR